MSSFEKAPPPSEFAPESKKSKNTFYPAETQAEVDKGYLRMISNCDKYIEEVLHPDEKKSKRSAREKLNSAGEALDSKLRWMRMLAGMHYEDSSGAENACIDEYREKTKELNDEALRDRKEELEREDLAKNKKNV